MTTQSQQLVADVHPALNTDAEGTEVLQFNTTRAGWLSISDSDLTLVLDENTPALVYALADYTIGELAEALPAELGVTVYSTDWQDVGAVSLIPLDGMTFTTGDIFTLRSYTAHLWRVMRPLAAGLAHLDADARALVRQADIRQASGSWLDLWGLIWHIPRLPDETAAAYRKRIIYTLTLPRVNNRALEVLILNALGRTATVEDGGVGGLFTLNVSGQSWGPGGSGVWGPQSYGQFVVTLNDDTDADTTQLIALIQQYKTAGVTFTVNTLYAPIARISFSDIIATWE